MADISPTSQSELVNRRQQLRRQRRWRTLKTVWQLLAVGGLTGGLLWALSLYDWMLRNPSQIKIQGNQVLSAETIRSLLPIRYPESLLTVQPQSIAHFLETEAPIAEATVVRQLFPPGLTVRIQERHPVAVVYLADPAAATVPRNQEQKAPMALIDEEGAWIPYDVYASLNPTNGLPELKVQGMREDYRSYWPDLYKQLSLSPVKVSEIDWRDPSNLILHTELGAVYLGSYSPRFPKQLKVLDEMRELPEQVSLDEIAYIDLRNPEIPVIEIGTPQVGAPPNADASTDSEP